MEQKHQHQNNIVKLRDGLASDEALQDLAELFKVFGDNTRIRIMCALFNSDLTVTEISELLDMSPSAISHQLRILKQSKLVKSQRDGKNMVYSLADDHVYTIFMQGLSHVME